MTHEKNCEVNNVAPVPVEPPSHVRTNMSKKSCPMRVQGKGLSRSDQWGWRVRRAQPSGGGD